jgi:hypothetical protein
MTNLVTKQMIGGDNDDGGGGNGINDDARDDG